MEIDGIMTNSNDGEITKFIGITGADLKCGGCGEKTNALYETADSVMLCEACSDAARR